MESNYKNDPESKCNLQSKGKHPDTEDGFLDNEKVASVNLHTEKGINSNSKIPSHSANTSSSERSDTDRVIRAKSNCGSVRRNIKSSNPPVLSWRDPNFQIERNAPAKRSNVNQNRRFTSKNRGEERDSIRESEDMEERKICSIVEKRRVNKSSNSDMISRELFGMWSIHCRKEVIHSDGITEEEDVWQSVIQLYMEHPALFAEEPTKYEPLTSNKIFIQCYTPDYRDTQHIAKVGNFLREKLISYPFVLFYRQAKTAPLYMNTCEGDIYFRSGYNKKSGWKILES